MTKEIDEMELLELLGRGYSPPELAQNFGVTAPTMRNKISELQKSQGVILQYRQLQNLRLTELQHAILEAITPEKIAEAPLNVLVQAFKILKDKELVMTGNPTEIKGLVGYLVELERQELAGRNPVDSEDSDIIEAETSEPYIPNLQ